MKRIRWWGLGVFVAVVGGIVLAWVLFADALVRSAFESAGTRMVGAKVELAAADIGFSPARLELRGLAVTDPDAPMRNAVEAERIALDIDWIGLLLDRVHVDEVAVEGLQFGTQRSSSGALARTPAAVRKSSLLASAADRFEIPPLEVPSVATVLERESLRSPEVIAAARTTLKERRAALDERLAQLPGSEELQRYRSEFEEARGGDGTKEKLKGLKRMGELAEAIDDDLERLRRARKEMRKSVDAARAAAREARRAPQDDIDRLYRKYTDPGAVAGELAHYLLGPRVARWVNQGWYWYGRLSPYLGGGEDGGEARAAPAVRRPGRVVVYPEAAAEPGVLVRRIRVSGAAGGGDLDGRITDIALPATLWGEPLRLQIEGKGVGGARGLLIDASVDRRRADTSLSRIDFGLTGADVTGLGLGPEGSLRAEQGRADIRVTGTVENQALDLDLTATLRGAAFRAADDAAAVLREVAGALGQSGAIEIGAQIGGTVDSPQLSLRSSLGALLEPMLRGRLQQAAAGFRDGLAEAVAERTGDSLEQLQQQAAALEQLEADLEARVEGFEETLKRIRKKLD